MSQIHLLCRCSLAVVALIAAPAVSHGAGPCQPVGRGAACVSAANCASYAYAKTCVAGTCQVPCIDAFGEAKPEACTLGEACVAGQSDTGSTYYCRAGTFAMDLNLLDMCIAHFVAGEPPDVTGGSSCSLDISLHAMLDQNADGVFNIFDVDACVRAFVFARSCIDGVCDDPADIYCESDPLCAHGGPCEGCPSGSYCDPDHNRCQRDCGYVGNRDTSGPSLLNRPCFGQLQTCDLAAGRCIDVDPRGIACEADRDCPTGAYCLMGECRPECSRSIDCGEGSWFCNAYNRCQVLPTVSGPSGFTFDPSAYSVNFSSQLLTLTLTKDRLEIPMVILDTRTRTEVHDNPAVSFGFRQQLDYAPKMNARCDAVRANTAATQAEQASCIVSDLEKVFILERPYGTLSAATWPSIPVSIDHPVAERLEPGTYQATLEAVFSNGTRTSTTLVFDKQSLSGDYSGQVSVYLKDPLSSLLGNSRADFNLFVDDASATIHWNTFMVQQGLGEHQDLTDVTEGFPVYGFLDGNTSPIFDRPGAASASQNRIPVKGIYSPSLRRMHLVGVIDLPTSHCRTDVGTCVVGQGREFRIENFFGRPLRRVLHFIGPYDAERRRFHGVYRETIKGFDRGDVTFDGGFILEQTRPGGGPAPAELPSQLATVGSNPVFPSHQSLHNELQSAINEACKAYPAAVASFTQAAFEPYVRQQIDNGGRILGNLVQFEDEIRSAIDVLGVGSSSALTLFEFLQGQIFLCSENDEATCINEEMVECGLALYRRAMVDGWVGRLPYGTPQPGGDELSCSPGSTLPGCNIKGADRPQLVARQDHNRFFNTVLQTLRYQAASDLSSAFYLLFRKANDPVSQAQALSEKQEKLQSAWGRYNQLLRHIFAPAASSVLLSWPMASYKGHGSEWLAAMHAVLGDRLDTLRELVDLKRRVFATSSRQDFLFVQDLMHFEYLAQAYMLYLQSKWQGANLQYAGHGPEALANGQQVLDQINDTRNPLGFHPNQIFFENSALERSNWRNYLSVLKQGGTTGGGLLGDTKALVNEAIVELKGALSSKNRLEESLLGSQQAYEDKLDQICGPEDSQTGDPECNGASAIVRQTAEALCPGPTCPFVYTCDGDNCEDLVLQAFSSGTSSAENDAACSLQTPEHKVVIGSTERNCVRGQVGALFQEKAVLLAQMKSVRRQVDELNRQMARLAAEYSTAHSDNVEINEYMRQKQSELVENARLMMLAEFVYESARSVARGVQCSVIVGFATGGDCITAPASIAASLIAIATRHGAMNYLSDDKMRLENDVSNHLREEGQDASERQLLLQLNNTLSGVQSLVGQYRVLVQQTANLDVRINDNWYLAQQAATHYQEQIDQLIDHLIGTEQGDVLRGNAAVMAANDKFQQVLRVSYKMAAAFAHSYNMADEKEAMFSRVYTIVTTNGVDQFIDYLETLERDYCGAGGFDCDAGNNVSTLRLSLRDLLFNFTDSVDPTSGRVTTRGEQFHAAITSSLYRKPRVRGPLTVEQIELLFTTPLGQLEPSGDYSTSWLISPLECNHIIAGRGNGTVAVNVIGTRLRPLRYELLRGNSDYLRGCVAESTIPPGGGMPIFEYPVSTFTVGYAPQNPLAARDVPEIYVTRSGFQPACQNRMDNTQGILEDESCYRYFARDRSLSSMNWTLVIPLDFEGNGWITGDGLLEEEKPIIEDIVLYLRYRSRPTVD